MSFTESLAALMPMQALAAALVLIVLIGWRGASPASRWAETSLMLLGVGLALVSPSFPLTHTVLWTSLGLGAISAGLSGLWWALGLWLLPRTGRWLMFGAPVVLTVGHALLAPGAQAQVLADAVFASQLALLASSLSRPARANVLQGLNARRWRTLGLAAVLPIALASTWRAASVLLNLPAGALPEMLLALCGQLALLLALPVLLLAWRSETETELARLAQTDSLTGLTDAPAFMQRSVDLISMARRYDEPLALMTLELDHLPTLTDERGEDMADRCLALFGSCVQAQMRLGDLAGRLGHQRFGVLMARCEALGPEALDARLRQALATRAPLELGTTLTFSAGWAKLRPGDRNLADLLRRAETALYEAREAGHGVLRAEPGVSD